jgi:hypothetical protein
VTIAPSAMLAGVPVLLLRTITTGLIFARCAMVPASMNELFDKPSLVVDTTPAVVDGISQKGQKKYQFVIRIGNRIFASMWFMGTDEVIDTKTQELIDAFKLGIDDIEIRY